jgi:head-tail adaptor
MARRTGFPSGKLDTRITILRRPQVEPAFGAGNTLGDYAPAFSRWAAYMERQLAQATESGAPQNVVSLTVTVRDDSETRTITTSDRMLIRGQNMAITGVGLPDRIGQIIQIDLESRRGG